MNTNIKKHEFIAHDRNLRDFVDETVMRNSESETVDLGAKWTYKKKNIERKYNVVLQYV